MRSEYWSKVKNIDYKNLVFLDEMGVLLGLKRTYARAAPGQRAYDYKPFYRGSKVSVIGAISESKILAVMTLNDSMDSAAFKVYISECLVPQLWKGAVVVMDNLPAHKVKAIAPLIESVGATILYLSPFSLIITELIEFGFEIELVLADSLYGEASSFIRTLDKYQLPWVVAIRNNHGVWLSQEQKVRANKWCKFKRTFSDQKSEIRYIREIIYGKRNRRTYWEITTDPETMPANSTSFVMTNIQTTRHKMKQQLGNLYGLRIGREYGFRQCKQELGWTNYRFTNFEQINRW